MKQTVRSCLLVLLGLAVGAAAMYGILRWTDVDAPAAVPTPGSAGFAPETVYTRADLIELSYAVVGYLSSGDFGALAGVVHPDRGLVFSPYATVSLTTDKYFSASDVAAFGSNNEIYTWGVMDGSGDAISMTVSDYIGRFVLDYDYAAAPLIGVNHIVRSGNALENVTAVYPDAQFVDLHYPGSEAYGYLDWSTLRLVFETFEGRPRLTAIIHSEATV